MTKFKRSKKRKTPNVTTKRKAITKKDRSTKIKEVEMKVESIRKDIYKLWDEHLATKRRSAEQACQLGKHFKLLQNTVKKRGTKWTEYVAEKFPHIHKRQVERYMRLANHIDLEKHPSLAAAGQERLLKTISEAKNEDVVDFLERQDVSLDFDAKNKKSAMEFNKKLDEIIKPNNNKNKKEKLKPVVIFKKSATSFLNSIDLFIKNKKPIRNISLKSAIERIEDIEGKLETLKKKLKKQESK